MSQCFKLDVYMYMCRTVNVNVAQLTFIHMCVTQCYKELHL